MQHIFWAGVSLCLVIMYSLDVREASIVQEYLISSRKNLDIYLNNIIPARKCNSWKQVNTNGFGLPTEFNTSGKPIKPTTSTPFQGEEGNEVIVFKNQLYLGMETDNALGARLWRTRACVTFPQHQLDWEEVSVIDGHPFGVGDLSQVDHIDSVAEFDSWIYASTANRSGNPQGVLVFRSKSGDSGSWENTLNTVGAGFGKDLNENFKDMQVFNDHHHGGTWNEVDGADVWCTNDGVYWQQKYISGFRVPANTIIWSGQVFKGYLYFGLQNSGNPGIDGDGRLFRTSSLAGNPSWEDVSRTEPGTTWGNILEVYEGYLYISVPSEDGTIIFRSSSGDPRSWQESSLPGFDNHPQNNYLFADGATQYNRALYAGVANGQSNFELCRTNR